MTLTRKAFLAVCVVLASSVSGFCLGPNLVVDGGFEQPVTGPGGLNSGFIAFNTGNTIGGAWSVSGPPPSADVGVYPGTEYTTSGGFTILFNVIEGAQALDMTGTFDTGAAMGIQQTVPTIAGKTYDLSFLLGAITSSHWGVHAGNANVNVFLNGNLLLNAVNGDPSGDQTTWKSFGTQFLATGPSTLKFVSNVGTSIGINALDNVSLAEVPEPGTGGLLLAGALALAAKAKRSRRA